MEREYELQTHRAEDRHWWYRGRRSVLKRALARIELPHEPTADGRNAGGRDTGSRDAGGATADSESASTANNGTASVVGRTRVLDAGCGSGRNMVELARHGTVTGIELSQTSVELARARKIGEVLEGSVLEMPFEDASFELSVSLDVIEHLEDDVGALRELRRVTAPGGALLVTVPAYQWLWSGHDELNHHHRRYNRATLRAAAEQAGWQLERTTHFNSLLLPAAIVLRALDRLNRRATESSLDLWVPPEPLNRLLELPLSLESFAIGRGGHIPAGLSLLAVFR
jgi:SAM-dependent methyltransferase